MKTSENIEKNARVNMKTSIEILEEIISKKCIDNAHLHMVLEGINISQPDGGDAINLEFGLKTPLKTHTIMSKYLSGGEGRTENKFTVLNAP